MKKIVTVLLVTVLAVLMAVAASADYELYSPDYYGIYKVESITVDGAVDEAYGEPIFYYKADGAGDPGDHTSAANWFHTTIPMSDENSEDVLFLVYNPECYVYAYAAWTEENLYVCYDVNIAGFNNTGATFGANGSNIWMGYCVQSDFFDFENEYNTEINIGIVDEVNGSAAPDTILQWWSKGNYTGPALLNPDNAITNFNVVITRDLDHLIYEMEIPFDKVFTMKPEAEKAIGLDVCVTFGTEMRIPTEAGGGRNFLTFHSQTGVRGYHMRDVKDGRRMYLLDENSRSAAELYSEYVNAAEAKATDSSISLFGCNEALNGMELDIESKLAGFACSSGVLARGNNTWDITLANPVDASAWDTLDLNIFVTDVSFFDLANAKIEIASGNGQTMSWTMEQIKAGVVGDIKAGWNHVCLGMSKATVTGDFNRGAINYFGFTANDVADGGIVVKFDNIRVNDDEAVQNAADQESAKSVDKAIENAVNFFNGDNYSMTKVKIQDARKKYDRLNDNAKSYIQNLAMLESMEAIIEAWENGDEPNDEPGTDEPGTDEPGTDEPGTDEPGTDEPGADEPGDKPDTPAPAGNNNMTTIIVIVAVVVVVVAALAVVYFVVIKKKK